MSSLFDLLDEVIGILDEFGLRWALGGSMASTLYAEPRTTVDIDVVVSFEGSTSLGLVDRLLRRFYVPRQAALDAIATGGSFNILDTESGFKVDFFVASDDVLDTNQLARRRAVELPSVAHMLWVTAPEDVILRKLEWWQATGESSDRQWRDIVGVLSGQRGLLAYDYLDATARLVHLDAPLAQAMRQAETE